jgi:2-keto-4-pentenoate hydratase
MPQSADVIEGMGRALANARKAGGLADVSLWALASDEEAEAVQIAARDATNDQTRGYSTILLRERIGTRHAESFVHGPLMEESLLDNGTPFRAPEGLLGARCALLFTMGRPYPDREAITRRTITEAIARCDLAIDLLGRRVANTRPLTAREATADFALHVATFRGPSIARWSDALWTDTPIVLAIDDTPTHTIAGSALLAHALGCLTRLTEIVSQAGGQLDAGDLVCAGWRLPAMHIRAGHELRVTFAEAGSVVARLA